MNATETRKPRPVLAHRRGLNLYPTTQLENLVTQPTALLNPPDKPDDFGRIVEQFHADTTPWGVSVNLTLEPLRPVEVKRQTAYLKAVPGSTPWTAFVQIYVDENGVISMSRMDDPENGWVLTADENDALMAAQREAGRRARANTPAPPDAA